MKRPSRVSLAIARSAVRRPPVDRRSRGRLSGSQRTTHTRAKRLIAVSATNGPRQPSRRSIWAPVSEATSGATPPMITIQEKSRAASRPRA